jgi:hypothetical protein
MATLTVRYDIPAPRFVHGFVYEGEETERAALKDTMRRVLQRPLAVCRLLLRPLVLGDALALDRAVIGRLLLNWLILVR